MASTNKSPLMGLDAIPDWEQRLARVDAFWDRAILDRPVVCICAPKSDPRYPRPAGKTFATHRDRWMDFEYVADCALADTMNREYLGDALPTAFPNLGPEIFNGFLGMELEFGEATAWSHPNLHDWSGIEAIAFDPANAYWRAVCSLTDILLAKGRGKFYTGLTDFHPGGDAAAAFRDPQQFNIDLIESPDEAKRLVRRVTDIYLRVFDLSWGRVHAAGQAITSWPGIVSTRKWYVPSNDFSCMVSPAMFNEFFLPGLVEECRALEASIYHLDGPNALGHLDSLLGIRELNAIQWVYGAGHGRASDWIPVYQRCQAAGKGLQIFLEPDEYDLCMEQLSPEGLYISTWVNSREEGEALLRKVARWR
ncbi:MAG: hypothetical protein WCR06_03105 [bacterium]